jgi:hypothetical protein
MGVVLAAALAAVLSACSPSPERMQPADPLAGAGGFQLHFGGSCSAALSNNPCPQ